MASSSHLEHPQTVYTLLSRYDVTIADVKELLDILGERYDSLHLDTILKKDVFATLAAVFEHDKLRIDYDRIEQVNREEERKYTQLAYFFRHYPEYHELAKRHKRLYRALLADCRFEDRGKHRYYYRPDLIRVFKQLQEIDA